MLIVDALYLITCIAFSQRRLLFTAGKCHYIMLHPPHSVLILHQLHTYFTLAVQSVTGPHSELQKCANRANWCKFSPAGAKFLAKHAKNCPTMSIAHISYIIALWATSTVNSTNSNVFLALVLVIHCPCICNSSTGASSTSARSTSARSTSAGSTGASSTSAAEHRFQQCGYQHQCF